MKKTKHDSKEEKGADIPSLPTDWRTETLTRIRILIQQADPDVVEDVKWRKPSNPAGVLVWSHDGIICTVGDVQDRREDNLLPRRESQLRANRQFDMVAEKKRTRFSLAQTRNSRRFLV